MSSAPGSQVMVWFWWSTGKILFMRITDIMMPPYLQLEPPARPVPAPRTTTGMLFSLQYFMMWEISSSEMTST